MKLWKGEGKMRPGLMGRLFPALLNKDLNRSMKAQIAYGHLY